MATELPENDDPYPEEPGPRAWIRTCDECGHKQKAKEPPNTKELSNSYCNSKCRRCKSEALDYGSWQPVSVLCK